LEFDIDVGRILMHFLAFVTATDSFGV